MESYELTTVVTPVNVSELEKLLKVSTYDSAKSDFLVKGFTEGFDIRYRGEPNQKSTSQNWPFKVGNRNILWNKLMKAVVGKCVAGPFVSIPFENFMQSPIGLVPKDNGLQTRLIFHL